MFRRRRSERSLVVDATPSMTTTTTRGRRRFRNNDSDRSVASESRRTIIAEAARFQAALDDVLETASAIEIAQYEKESFSAQADRRKNKLDEANTRKQESRRAFLQELSKLKSQVVEAEDCASTFVGSMDSPVSGDATMMDDDMTQITQSKFEMEEVRSEVELSRSDFRNQLAKFNRAMDGCTFLDEEYNREEANDDEEEEVIDIAEIHLPASKGGAVNVIKKERNDDTRGSSRTGSFDNPMANNVPVDELSEQFLAEASTIKLITAEVLSYAEELELENNKIRRRNEELRLDIERARAEEQGVKATVAGIKLETKEVKLHIRQLMNRESEQADRHAAAVEMPVAA